MVLLENVVKWLVYDVDDVVYVSNGFRSMLFRKSILLFNDIVRTFVILYIDSHY